MLAPGVSSVNSCNTQQKCGPMSTSTAGQFVVDTTYQLSVYVLSMESAMCCRYRPRRVYANMFTMPSAISICRFVLPLGNISGRHAKARRQSTRGSGRGRRLPPLRGYVRRPPPHRRRQVSERTSTFIVPVAALFFF